MNSTTSTVPRPADVRRWLALVAACLGQVMIVLDTTVVNVALPAVQRDLHFSQANLTWVVNIYLIAFGSFLLLAGRMGDLVGRKKVFIAGVVVFTIASAFCGLSQNQSVLLAGRFVQGLGGAMASSVVVALLVTEFTEPRERAQAMSIYTFVAIAGGSIGLIAGGVITQSVNWHWIFFINLPIGLLTLLLGGTLIRENRGLGLGQGVDVAGSVLVTGALMTLVYAIVTSTQYGWASAHTLGFGAAALGMLAAFGLLESRLDNPIVPMRVLAIRSLAGSNAARAVMVTGMFSSFFLGALYFEHVLRYGPVQTGLAFLPHTLVVAALSLGVSAALMRRFGPRAMLVPGLSFLAGGLVLLSTAGVQASYYPQLFFAFVLTGLGTGTSFLPLLTLAMADVPSADSGLASGLVNVSVQLGAAVGVAALGAISADHTRALISQGEPLAGALVGGYHLAFLTAAGCVAACVLAVLIALRSPGRPNPREVQVEGEFREAA
ncbi:MAG: MFS transporter [Candidatus Dormibacteraeota bacterium]|nr:MFS transporter [Candidatus Dormibacteraeota bacterium]